MTMSENKILVGKIVAPQGIRGDVRVQTYTAHPDDFRNLMILTERFASADFKFVRRLNPTSDVIIAHVVGFDDRNAAETLRGAELFIDRGALPAPCDGEYYQADLIGFAVIRNGNQIGVVDCFHNFGAGDIMELEDGSMVSFKDAKVDLTHKKIEVL